MEDPEIEMRYLAEKRKTDDTIYTVDKKKLEGLKKLRDKGKTKIEDFAGILEYQKNPVESVGFIDIPHIRGNINLLGKDDPDIILGQLKCGDRVNYCKINPELWKKCKEREIHDKYILPCKMNATINKKINEVCEGGYYPDNEEFNEMLDELSEEYPCLMEQNILSYLKRYLSYGDKSETVLEYRVYFDVRRNRFTGMVGMNVIDELVELERIKWGKMWNPDDFLDAVNNFIGVEQIKEMIEEWRRVEAWDWDDESEEIYQTMKRHQEEYIEGSLIWWVSMLNCKLVPFIRDTTSPYTMVDKRIFRFLLEMEDSFLEIFDGTTFTEDRNQWFVYGDRTRQFILTDTYRNWEIDTWGFEPKIKEVLRWLRHVRTKQDMIQKLISMKNTFVKLGSSKFQRSRLEPGVTSIPEVDMYRYFEEFIDLLNFNNNPLIQEIEKELETKKRELYDQMRNE